MLEFVGPATHNESPIPFSYDADTGHLIFAIPTWKVAGGRAPDDVRVLLAVNVGSLTATKPDAGYEGTSYTTEGLERTLVVTARDWRDPANQSNMEAYAQSILDSVKDTIIEGSATYYGLYPPSLLPGEAGLSIAGSDYPTGYESLNLPIVETEITWNSQSGV